MRSSPEEIERLKRQAQRKLDESAQKLLKSPFYLESKDLNFIETYQHFSKIYTMSYPNHNVFQKLLMIYHIYKSNKWLKKFEAKKNEMAGR